MSQVTRLWEPILRANKEKWIPTFASKVLNESDLLLPTIDDSDKFEAVHISNECVSFTIRRHATEWYENIYVQLVDIDDPRLEFAK